MSELLPGDQPAVFAAERIVQDEYETYQLENEYGNSKSEAIVCAGMGSLALVGGLALTNFHPEHLTGLTEVAGWTYATSGAAFIAMGALATIKAGREKLRLHRRQA